MSRYEYLTVLLSIVIALGLSEITGSWGRLIQHRHNVRFSWIHSIWSILVLLLMVQYWWGFWNYRTVDEWSFAVLLALVAETMTLVMCGLLLTPGRSIPENLDLEQHFFRHARPFFLFAAFLLIQLSLVDILVIGIPLLHAENLIRAIGIVLVTVLAFTENRPVHFILSIAVGALFAAFLVYSVML